VLKASYGGALGRVHPDDRAIVKDAVARVLATHKDSEIRRRFVRADGTVRFVDGRGRLSLMLPGRPSAPAVYSGT
jgi:hypothetical protein